MSSPIEVPFVSDEPLASVTRVLCLNGGEDDRFLGDSLPQIQRIYGGQVIAQALLAAAATLDGESDERPVHSLHAYFLRGGDPSKPLEFAVKRTHDGRSFTSRQVNVMQEGRDILTLMASFQRRQSGIEHTANMPDVPQPESLQSALEVFRTLNHPVGKFLGRTAAFDVRHVQEPIYVGSNAPHERTQQLWMRPRAEIKDASPTIARALLAYVVDQVMCEPALRQHGLAWLTPGMALASLDHAMWFIRDFDINDWLLYEQESPFAAGARALGRARIFSRNGDLVAEAAQEAMIRVPREGQKVESQWGFEHAAS